jgi:hypothetical protein
LNGTKKYFVTLDENKKEVKNEISTIDEIFNYTDSLIKIIENYDKSKEGN